MWPVLFVALAAQQAAPSPEAEPDIEISATVRYRELRFEKVGEASVDFAGTPDRETRSHTDRGALPRPVQPGVTYRNGRIVLTITSRFHEELHRRVPALDAAAAPGDKEPR